MLFWNLYYGVFKKYVYIYIYIYVAVLLYTRSNMVSHQYKITGWCKHDCL